MSEKIGAEKMPPDEDKERQRQAIEYALLAFRPDVRREFSDLIQGDMPEEGPQALRNLYAADVPRVFMHRVCLDGWLRTRDEDRAGLRESVKSVLRYTIPQGRDILAPRFDKVIQQLDELTEGTRLQQRHWEQWVATTADVFEFTTHEETFQACNDNQKAMKATPNGQLVQSRLIVAEFWSDLPPSAFAKYVDPMNWPILSPFWKAMKELRPKEDLPNGYDCDFEETVKIFNEELSVPLQVAFRQRPDQSRVWTRFNIARPFYTSAVPVDVDTGTVSAESIPGGLARTRVQATKYLHWSDPNRPDFTGLSCDFEWSELMTAMADASLAGTVLPPQTLGPTAPRRETPVDDAVKRFVDDVLMEWTNGIGDYNPHLRNLIRRFTGPSWNLRWINDLLAMGKVTADRSGAVASHVRRLADSLKAADGRENDNER